MVGLGENKNEILQVMDDLRTANVDFLTIGNIFNHLLNIILFKDIINPMNLLN